MDEKDIHATYQLLSHQVPLELRVLKVNASGRTSCVQDCMVHSSEQLVQVCGEYEGTANLYVGLRERRGDLYQNAVQVPRNGISLL